MTYYKDIYKWSLDSQEGESKDYKLKEANSLEKSKFHLERLNRDFYFAKFDSNGALVCDKNFGSDANDEMTAIDFDGNSSFYLTGFTEGNYKIFVNRGKKDFVYMKYTDDGTEESNYQFGTEWCQTYYV